MMRSLASLLCTAALLAACATAPPDVTPATSLPASTGPQESGATTDHPSASVTVPGASAASATPPDGGHVNLDAHPLVWFTPHPYVRLPDFNKGSTDYFDLFAPDSAWTTAAGRVQVFKLYDGLALGREPTDQELLTVIQGVRQRSLALAFELGPLPHPDGGGSNTDCGRGVEGYSAPFSLDIIRRVVALGGRVDLVAFDEPLAHGHYYDGPNACGWPIEHVASEVFGFVRSLRAIAPDVIVGDIEPAWIQPNIGAAEIGAWLDAYAAVSGERFGFFHLDLDWHRADWPALAVDVERTVRDRGVPSGIIYNGGEDATSNAEWLQLAADRAYQFEQLAGGRPDQVVFQSWHYYPTRVLPETDSTGRSRCSA
jgi:hypothetical protein